MKIQQQWQEMAQQIQIDGRAVINGARCDTEQHLPIISPIDQRELGQLSIGDDALVNRAVACARDAFQQGVWAETDPAERKRVLHRFADLMQHHREELALLETLETGKPITNSFAHDMAGAIRCMRWYAEGIDKIYGEIPQTAPDALALVRREPIGVIGGILPWNFPLMLLTWKLAPALALGNSIVVKPSEKSSLTSLRMADIALEAGLPHGVFSVVPGLGETVGKALALHQEIDSLVFTGSTRTAKQLLKYAGDSNMKRIAAETGGKSANIIFADCYDLEQAAQAAADAIFYNQGQVCIAGSRLLLEERLVADFLPRLLSASQRYIPKHPLDPDCTMGCVIDAQHHAHITRFIEQAIAEGAECLLDGRCDRHNQIGPTIFKTSPEQTIAREEIFGPVLSVMTFRDEEEALRMANDSIYGLGAAVWTRDLKRAHRMARKLQAGSVFINNYNDGDMSVPWGGFKQSGSGADKSFHALDKFSELKTTWINLS